MEKHGKCGKLRISGESFIVLFLLAAILIAGGSDAAASENGEASSQVSLVYEDDDAAKEPVSGAVFRFYKLADTVNETQDGNTTGRIIPLWKDENGKEIEINERRVETIAKKIRKIYETNPREHIVREVRTDETGCAELTLEYGIWLAEEVTPARWHIVSQPFLIELPQVEKADGSDRAAVKKIVTLEPKPVLCGDLKIRKILKGSGADTKRAFDFILQIPGNTRFDAEYSSGKKITVGNGSRFSLRGGESLRVYSLPAGLAYTVTEDTGRLTDYRSTIKKGSGRIKGGKLITVTAVNEKLKPAHPADTDKKSLVKPVKTGDSEDAVLYLAMGLLAMCTLLLTVWLYLQTGYEKKRDLED